MILSPTFWPSGIAVLAYALATVWPLRAADALSPAQPEAPEGEGLVRKALLLGWLAQGAAIALDALSLDSPLPGARFGFAPALCYTEEDFALMFARLRAILDEVLAQPEVRQAVR